MNSRERNETELQRALYLVKLNITEEETTQNLQLHEAVQLIVNVVREYGYCQK